MSDILFWCKLGKDKYARLCNLYVDGNLVSLGIVCPDGLAAGQTVWVRKEYLHIGEEDHTGIVHFTGHLNSQGFRPRLRLVVRSRKMVVEKVDLDHQGPEYEGAVWLQCTDPRHGSFFGPITRMYGTPVEYDDAEKWRAGVASLKDIGQGICLADDPGARMRGVTNWTEWHCISSVLLKKYGLTSPEGIRTFLGLA
jgi:hypothetical protein